MSHAECDKCLKLCCNFYQPLFEVYLQWEKVRYTETEQCWCKLLINGGGVGGVVWVGSYTDYRVTTLVTLKNVTLTLAILSDFQWPISTSDGAIAPTAYHYNYSHVQASYSSKLPWGAATRLQAINTSFTQLNQAHSLKSWDTQISHGLCKTQGTDSKQ